VGGELSVRHVPDSNDFALLQVQSQAEGQAALLSMRQSSWHCRDVASDDAIVQVEGCQV
jgi:hypothetical protein